jgi:hypothetical protein
MGVTHPPSFHNLSFSNLHHTPSPAYLIPSCEVGYFITKNIRTSTPDTLSCEFSGKLRYSMEVPIQSGPNLEGN